MPKCLRINIFTRSSKRNNIMTYYLDGNNICFWKDENNFSLVPLLNLCVQLKNKSQNFVCFFDANIIHLLKDKEEKLILKDLLKDKTKFRTSPGGTKADNYIVMSANNSNASIITNDWYRSLIPTYKWLDSRSTPQRLFKGSVYPEANGDFLMIPDLKINALIEPNIQTLLFKLNINNNQSSFKSSNTMTNELRVGKISAPQTFHQLGILVLDGSLSMTDSAKMNLTKAQSVNVAVRDLLGRMKASKVATNFSFAVIMFGNDAKLQTTITPLSSIDDNGNFDPLIVDGTNTKIFLGLNEAKALAGNFLNSSPEGGVNHSVIILLMSDGICSEPKTTISVSQNLKNDPQVKIACAYFGTLGKNDTQAEDLLKETSSDPTQYYKITYGAEDLRTFFEASISKSAGIKVG